MTFPSRFFDEIVALPYPAMAYRLSQRIHDQFPFHGILETEDYDFDLDAFAEAGGCSVRRNVSPFGHAETKWTDQQIRSKSLTGLLDIEWRGQALMVFRVAYDDCHATRNVIVAENVAVAEQFFAAVCGFNTNTNDSILIMSSDGFYRDDALLEGLRSFRWESLDWLLNLQSELVRNCEQFFAARSVYEENRLAWKRGVIMHGPPGNGKTFAIKALINRLRVPVIYVRTFQKRRSLETENIEKAFRRAREMAPCMLVLEDIDSLVSKDSMSFFLNEMDGFRANSGILTVATTNHLEKLDAALTNRPSRFDRKVLVDNPNKVARSRFLVDRLGPEAVEVAELTEGFSVAFLTELCVIARLEQMNWPDRPLGEVLRGAVADLRVQLSVVMEGD